MFADWPFYQYARCDCGRRVLPKGTYKPVVKRRRLRAIREPTTVVSSLYKHQLTTSTIVSLLDSSLFYYFLFLIFIFSFLEVGSRLAILPICSLRLLEPTTVAAILSTSTINTNYNTYFSFISILLLSFYHFYFIYLRGCFQIHIFNKIFNVCSLRSPVVGSLRAIREATKSPTTVAASIYQHQLTTSTNNIN